MNYCINTIQLICAILLVIYLIKFSSEIRNCALRMLWLFACMLALGL